MTKELLKRSQMATGLQVLTSAPLHSQLFLFKMEGRGSAMPNYAKGKSAKTRFLFSSVHKRRRPMREQRFVEDAPPIRKPFLFQCTVE
ncbi:uncharacterized protein TNIN_150851 [Trichonephila inaurata madagascariensis]|uniref:Uncharacterized protein n=1 Tax=Trichonephila inaurata madagascariensis TaxID=2747483 RepID=A0A8X6Y057_9ARAC|nr:uncharacterized protein TNIN_150851 [Trichonephila inaurata madagascariensis]